MLPWAPCADKGNLLAGVFMVRLRIYDARWLPIEIVYVWFMLCLYFLHYDISRGTIQLAC
jgi:hypothetical protein